MRYISLFSGIEAASVAWEDLGWEPVAFSEIAPFPCEVLKQRFPSVPNLGDITQIDWNEVLKEYGTVDLVVGGSPCQSFSIAGSRSGLDGESGLMWEYVRAVRELRPRYVLWENVPGALSSCTRETAKGDDFRCLLSALDDLGYGMAGRVLDAQFFGVPQRRRRIFLVGCLGDPISAAEVLFERESLRWVYPSSKRKREELAQATYRSTQYSHILSFDAAQITSPTNRSNPQWDDPYPTLVSNARPVVCITGDNGRSAIDQDLCGTILVGGDASIVAFPWNVGGEAAGTCITDGTSPTLRATRCGEPAIAIGDRSDYIVRRLMPIECERLQGFPDGWTDIEIKGKPASDSARYAALGNSIAVPVLKWIGQRIDEMEKNR